jgi:hypothetical protein
MIRTEIPIWLAILGTAGAVCFPVAIGVSELAPRGANGGGGYPLRIALPEVKPTIALVLARDSAAIEEAQSEAEDELDAEAANLPLAVPSGETLAGAQARPSAVGSKARDNVLLDLDYDLSNSSGAFISDSATGDVEVAKRVRVDGTDLGQATIRVTSDATLLIARDEIVALLESTGHADMARTMTAGAPNGRFISFEELRQRGINVHYDAAADHLALSI